MVFNTDAVKDPPKSYADLWKPDYAGRLVMLDDSRAIIGAALLTLGYDVNTTDPAQLERPRTSWPNSYRASSCLTATAPRRH